MSARLHALTLGAIILAFQGCGDDATSAGGPSPGGPYRDRATGAPLSHVDMPLRQGSDLDDTRAFEGLYAPDRLAAIYITLSDAAMEGLADAPRVYQPAAFRYVPKVGGEEEVFRDVGVRLKGRFSFRGLADKASFKIKLDEYRAGQRFKGLKRLTLNNMIQDPSALRERLAYRMYRAAGVPAPLCNHARVYVNGEYFGLYANVQTIDKAFLKQHYPQPDGNLYDTINNRDVPYVDLVPAHVRYFELESDNGINDTADLRELVQVLRGPRKRFYRDAGLLIDWEALLTAGAVQAVIADWDGYFGSSNNYKLYHDTRSDRFVMFPWGSDQSFNIWGGRYTMRDYAIDAANLNRPHGVIFRKCLADASCRAAYLEKVAEVVEIFDAIDWQGEIDAILAVSEAAIREDTRMQLTYPIEDFERSVEEVRDFVDERGDLVTTQLAAAEQTAGVVRKAETGAPTDKSRDTRHRGARRTSRP